jgi:hypothetical protein
MPGFELNLFLLGCLGGLLPDVLRIIKSRYDNAMPNYLRTPLFWAGLLLSVLLGGMAAWVFGATNANEAVAYGFTAPALLEGLAGGLQARPLVARPRNAGAPPPAEARRFRLPEWWAV